VDASAAEGDTDDDLVLSDPKEASDEGTGTRASASAGSSTQTFSNDLRVAQDSVYSVVAGAIAKKIRAGARPTLTSIGAKSVEKTVLALTQTRKYLRDDNIDISFRPEFMHLTMDGEQRSALRFHVLRKDL